MTTFIINYHRSQNESHNNRGKDVHLVMIENCAGYGEPNSGWKHRPKCIYFMHIDYYSNAE